MKFEWPETIEWPDGRPIPNNLTVHVQVAVSRRPDDNMMSYITKDTGHRRVTIEGKQEDVQPFIDAVAPLIKKLQEKHA